MLILQINISENDFLGVQNFDCDAYVMFYRCFWQVHDYTAQ